MKLSLIGLPGSGKTTLGRQLATHFGLPFQDLDAVIERRTEQSVAAIFTERGEAGFRQLEAEALHSMLGQPGPLVLATGGGTPCFHDNMALLNSFSLTVWLDVPLPVLAGRLQAAEGAKRPLLAAAGSVETWLHETLTARHRFYSQAQLRWAGGGGPGAEELAQLAAAGFPGTRLAADA